MVLLEAFRLIVAEGFKLATHREKRAHDRFDGLVNPMYEQILEIHKDYVALFNSAHLAVQRHVPIAEVVEELALSLMTSSAMRHEFFRVVAAVNANRSLPREVLHFVGAIGGYVESLAMYSTGTPATVVRTYLSLIASREEGAKSSAKLIEAREQAGHMLKRALAHLDDHAKAISSSYAGLLAARYV